MLIVAGTINVDPAHVARLGEAATVMMAATMQEPGCLQYVFSVSVADPGSIQIFEAWESAEDLEEHFEMPHMAVFRAAMSEVTVIDRSLHRYEVASFEPM